MEGKSNTGGVPAGGPQKSTRSKERDAERNLARSGSPIDDRQLRESRRSRWIRAFNSMGLSLFEADRRDLSRHPAPPKSNRL